jgi:hypothetical protein
MLTEGGFYPGRDFDREGLCPGGVMSGRDFARNPCV